MNTDLYNLSASSDVLNKKLFLKTESIKILYTGNIGYAKNLEPLVALV